jgi:signal transduction histidine kinase/ActR/RegA family two-component response regulator
VPNSRIFAFRGPDATSRAVSAVGIVLVIGILAVAVTAVAQLRKQSERVTLQRAQGQAVSMAADAKQALAAADFIVRTVQREVATAGVRDGGELRRRFQTPEENELLLFREGSFEPIDLIVLADGDGRLVSLSRRGPTPEIDVADQAYFQEARAAATGRPFVSPPTMSRISGRRDFFLARRLQSADGRFLGVVAVGLSCDYFAHLYDALRLGREDDARRGMSSIALLRSDSTVLARAPEDPAEESASVARGARARQDVSSSPAASAAGARASSMDVVTREVQGFPLAVEVATDRALYAAIARRQSVLIGSLAMLAVTTIGYTFVALVRVLRRREEFLAENQRLRISAEAASKAKSQFLATVSHEIRTPMNGIIGAAELLAARDLPEEAHRLAAMLLRSGRNLLGMLNDVLDFSRIEAGELHIVPEAFDSRMVVRDVAELFHAFATTKGLTMQADVAADVPQRLVGDAARIRQVLSNLVGNAVKFTDTGFVALRASVERSSGAGRTLTFEVEDSGVGIPAEARERIFDAFAQADSSVERRFGGSGLGLAISRRLALLMGGSLDFVKRQQGGTCFHFRIPLRPAPDGDIAKPAAPSASTPRTAPRDTLPPLHVLVTEDNAVNAMVVEAQLESLGCTCDVAVDGDDALAHLAHHRYDAVLMDCMLPGMSGYEATRVWREREAHRSAAHLPIIALTANALASNVELARDAGMDDFLTKPCALEDLRAALLRATNRRTAQTGGRPALSRVGGA